MREQIKLASLKQNLDFFNKMYDAVRIVDPLNKRVLDYCGCSLEETEKVCYDYWKSGEICDNCISVRAHHENKSYMKLEQSPDLILMVTALPIETAEQPTVLELLKNATDTMMIGSGNYHEGSLMRNVVSKLNDMVIKDYLTSLFNRRFVDDRLPVDIVKSTIEDQPLSVIFMDIDNFKKINDLYGHSVGDLVLKEVGNAIQSCIRSNKDWAARYGGDEFLICLNNATGDEAFQVAERIRTHIEKTAVPLKNGSVNITVSMGIHTMQETKLTARELISLADQKMFAAKKSGKNLIVDRDVAKTNC